MSDEIFCESNGFDFHSFLSFCQDDYDGATWDLIKQNFKLLCKLFLRYKAVHGTPIHFLASLFMLSLINEVFDSGVCMTCLILINVHHQALN